MHMLSRKDLNWAELETIRVSRNPATVITANGEVQIHEGATVNVHDLELRDGTNPRRHVCSPVAKANSAKNTDVHMSGTVVESPDFTQHGRTSSATRRTLHRLLSQDYGPVLPARVQVRLLHLYRRTHPMIPRRVQQQHEVIVEAFRHWETRRELQRTPKTQIQIGTSFRHRKSRRRRRKHPQTLLSIQIRNVLQKLYRGSKIFILTCRKTEIAKSARESRLQGLLAGSALVLQFLEQKTLVT